MQSEINVGSLRRHLKESTHVYTYRMEKPVLKPDFFTPITI